MKRNLIAEQVTERLTAKKIKYTSEGYVYGTFWGGGEGAYPARKLEAATLDELIKQAQEGVDTGSLDSGMGYERVLGAILCVTVQTIIVVNKELFSNEKTTIKYVGSLTTKQKLFLHKICV
jgi:hypothetical protein